MLIYIVLLVADGVNAWGLLSKELHSIFGYVSLGSQVYNLLGDQKRIEQMFNPFFYRQFGLEVKGENDQGTALMMMSTMRR